MQSGSITEFGTERTIEQRANMQRVIKWLAAGAPHTVLKDGSVLEGFDYSIYIDVADAGSTTGQCGTVGCIAGTAVQFDSPVTITDGRVDVDYNCSIEQKALSILGLSLAEGELLFYPFDLDWLDIKRTYKGVGLVRSPEYLDIGFSEAVEDDAEDDSPLEQLRYAEPERIARVSPLEQLRYAEPEQIARVLQHFQDTGVIDWYILEN